MSDMGEDNGDDKGAILVVDPTSGTKLFLASPLQHDHYEGESAQEFEFDPSSALASAMAEATHLVAW